MSESNIEWTEHTWNPVRGCSCVSPGCKLCYAMRDAARKDKNPKLPGYKGFAIFNERHEPHWTGKVELIPEMLDVPLKRRVPTTYFVNSMSDLFHEKLTDEDIDRVFGTMARCPQHTFQVLTKRADRLLAWASRTVMGVRIQSGIAKNRGTGWGNGPAPAFPLPNVWLGVSVENQEYANIRIPQLLQTPAAVRFLSCEPLLGPLDLRNLRGNTMDCLTGRDFERIDTDDTPAIDWVICGGESGPGARPMHPDWVRGIRDQCVAAGVPFFFKQWGSHMPGDRGTLLPVPPGAGYQADDMFRCSKKEAGRLLDGREWGQMPGVSQC